MVQTLTHAELCLRYILRSMLESNLSLVGESDCPKILPQSPPPPSLSLSLSLALALSLSDGEQLVLDTGLSTSSGS
jgi:hypothetical protein